jgi:uncharacterized protein
MSTHRSSRTFHSRALAWAALATLSLGLVAPARAQGGGSPPPPEIVTSGMGEARVTPDRAVVMIGVQSRAATATAAATDNARKLRAVRDTLVAMGIAPEQLATMNYSVHPEQVYDREGQRPRITGYIVQNMLRVEVRQMERAGAVLDAALARGANQIHSFDFYASNTDQARRSALSDAVSKARADAETAARAAGGTLGALQELIVGAAGGPMPRVNVRRGDMAMMEAASAAPTPVEPGQEVVRTVVTVRWQFVPAR